MHMHSPFIFLPSRKAGFRNRELLYPCLAGLIDAGFQILESLEKADCSHELVVLASSLGCFRTLALPVFPLRPVAQNGGFLTLNTRIEEVGFI